MNTRHVTNALYYIGLVKDYTGITKVDAENNVSSIVSALKEIEKVSVDMTAIRLKLDELLRIWQMKWNLSADVVSQVSRYKLAYETDSRKLDKKVSVCHSGACAERSRCTSGIILDSSFPRTSVGNPLPCNNPILFASTGSTSSLTTSTTVDTIYYYHTDHLGTPMLITDINQNVVWQKETLPFGEDYSASGSITNNLGFPGQYYDSETGRYYNWHRYYNAEIGRYDQFDPILHPGNSQSKKCGKNKNLNIPSFETLLINPQNLNPFAYVGNNSINFIDPEGLKAKDYQTGDLCIEKLKQRKNSGSCPTEEDCTICCADLSGETETEKFLICESLCISWLKSMK